MFTAALFTIATPWKQPQWPAEEWVKKTRCVCTMEWYSAIKRNETGPFAEMWMDLEIVIQSEVSQKEKYRIICRICESEKISTDDLIYKAEIET